MQFYLQLIYKLYWDENRLLLQSVMLTSRKLVSIIRLLPKKMLYLLKFISLELTGDHDLDTLLQVVQHNQWYPKYDCQRITFNAVELATVHTFQSIWKEVNNPIVTPPNCKGSLLCSEMLQVLLLF